MMMKKSMQEQLDTHYCRTGYIFQGMKSDGTPDCVSIGAMYGTDGGTSAAPEAPSTPEAPTTPPSTEDASNPDGAITEEIKKRTGRDQKRINANGVVQQGTAMGNGVA